MSDDMIITLADQREYEILSRAKVEGKEYCLVEQLNCDNEKEKHCFIEINKKDDEEYVKVVSDSDIIEQLLVLFVSKYEDDVEMMGDDYS